MRKSKKIIIASLIIIVAIGYLIFAGVRKSGVYYWTVSEVKKAGIKQGVRVEGKVVPGSTRWNPQQPKLTFQITDGKQKLAVIYKNLKPDSYKEGRSAIVEGTYKPNINTIYAEKVLTKCPSKYEKKENNK